MKKKVELYNPNNTTESVLIHKSYQYINLKPEQTKTLRVDTEREISHYRESANIHDLEITILNEEAEEDEQEEVEESVEGDSDGGEPDGEMMTNPENVEEETEDEEEEEQEDEQEEEVEESEEDEVEEVELDLGIDMEEVSEEVGVAVEDLEELKNVLAGQDVETLEALADKYDITTYNASNKDTLIKWILKQADNLPEEEF